jgi:hypothetical protein
MLSNKKQHKLQHQPPAYPLSEAANVCALFWSCRSSQLPGLARQQYILTLIVNQAQPAVELEACAKRNQHQPICGPLNKRGNLQSIYAHNPAHSGCSTSLIRWLRA